MITGAMLEFAESYLGKDVITEWTGYYSEHSVAIADGAETGEITFADFVVVDMYKAGLF